MRMASGNIRKLQQFSLLKLSRRKDQFICCASTDTKEYVPANLIDEDEDVTPVQVNKSRLLPQHRNVLLDKKPYEEAQSWIHNTEKYQRNMFGRYGLASGIDPRICFPTKEDVEDKNEYERVAFPYSIQKMMEISRKAKEAEELAIQKREDAIAKKLEKLEQWKRELNARIAKKEADARAAKERKERLVEEVRRHFGFKVDPRDDRFKEMLEQKEKEDKKKQKEAKKKAKEDKKMAKLVEKFNKDGTESAEK